MLANMLKQYPNGTVYVDLADDSLIEEEDEELLALEYRYRRGPDHVGYVILNPRTYSMRDIYDERYHPPQPDTDDELENELLNEGDNPQI